MTCVSVNAQGKNDAFINDWGGSRTEAINPGLIVALPGWDIFGQGVDPNTEPLGSGLLIMAALGAGYALKRKSDNQKQ